MSGAPLLASIADNPWFSFRNQATKILGLYLPKKPHVSIKVKHKPSLQKSILLFKIEYLSYFFIKMQNPLEQQIPKFYLILGQILLVSFQNLTFFIFSVTFIHHPSILHLATFKFFSLFETNFLLRNKALSFTFDISVNSSPNSKIRDSFGICSSSWFQNFY